MKHKLTKAEDKARLALVELRKAGNEGVLKIAKLLRSGGDARVRQHRINEVLDGFKGSVAVEVYQRAEIRNAKLGASNVVLVKL